jgi:hypothetical protein
MARLLSNSTLRKQNQTFKGTGSISEKNRSQGFIPAFYDSKSHQAHISRFENGTPAPIHILDGLPEEWIVKRDASGIGTRPMRVNKRRTTRTVHGCMLSIKIC